MKPGSMKFSVPAISRVATMMVFAGLVFWAGDLSVRAQGSPQQASPKKEKTVIGRVEKVWIGNAELELPAKIDTGARTTSLHASKIEIYKRGDKDWARFTLPNQAGVPVTLEREILKFQKIKKKNSDGTEVRPVVLLKLCIGDIYSLTQVNLFDRGKFAFPVLIGRRFLLAKATVDVQRRYTSAPRCKEMKDG